MQQMEASQVRIQYGSRANANAVHPQAEQTLREICLAAGESSCLITSTLRSPKDQARIMYDNLTDSTQGVKSQQSLYGPAGDKVIQVFLKARRAKKPSYEIRALMEAEIIRLGPGKVSRHCGDSSRLTVIDIDPYSIQHKEKFIASVAAHKRVSKFLKPPLDKAYHIEIPILQF